MVRERRVQRLGATRQELLSGIREASQFRRIRTDSRPFAAVFLRAPDDEEAAQMRDKGRSAGVASTAMLICAVALQQGWQIFTTDRDFNHYARAIPLQLFSVAESECFQADARISPNTSAVKASMVAPFFHASSGRPAFRQVCSRKVVRSQWCSVGTWGRRRPRCPAILISRPCRPITMSSPEIGWGGDRMLSSISSWGVSERVTG